MLLDEPFNALDSDLQARMRREVLQVRERFEVPILLITHDAADAAVFGRQVIRIDEGRIVEERPRANFDVGPRTSKDAIGARHGRLT